jgi:hypothetical protein
MKDSSALSSWFAVRPLAESARESKTDRISYAGQKAFHEAESPSRLEARLFILTQQQG